MDIVWWVYIFRLISMLFPPPSLQDLYRKHPVSFGAVQVDMNEPRASLGLFGLFFQNAKSIERTVDLSKPRTC